MPDRIFEETVFPEEIEEIRKRRAAVEQDDAPLHDTPRVDNELVGLAISGGGVRSASFALGVVQALAHRGVLSRVDLLSTVSGGGFLGSCLSALLHNQRVGVTREDFPLAHDPSSSEPPALSHVRAYSAYLAPDGTVDQLRIPALLLRGILVNLATVLPLLLLAVVITWAGYQPTPVLTDFLCKIDSDVLVSSQSVLVGAQSCDDRMWTIASVVLAGGFTTLFVLFSLFYPLILRQRLVTLPWTTRNGLGRITAVLLALSLAASALVPLLMLTHMAILTSFDELERGIGDLARSLVDLQVLGGAAVVIGLLALGAARSERFLMVLRTIGLYAAGLAGPALLVALYLLLCVVIIKPPYVYADLVIDELRSGQVGPRLATVLHDRHIGETYGRNLRADPSRWTIPIDVGVLTVTSQDIQDLGGGDTAVSVSRTGARMEDCLGNRGGLPSSGVEFYVSVPDGFARVYARDPMLAVARIGLTDPGRVVGEPLGADCDPAPGDDQGGPQLRMQGEAGGYLHGVINGQLARDVIEQLDNDNDEAVRTLLGLPLGTLTVDDKVDNVWQATHDPAESPDEERRPNVQFRLIHECWQTHTPAVEPTMVRRSADPEDPVRIAYCELASGMVGPQAAALLDLPLGSPADAVFERHVVGDATVHVRDRIHIRGPGTQNSYLIGEVATRVTTELRDGRVGAALRGVLRRGGIEVPAEARPDPLWSLNTLPEPDEEPANATDQTSTGWGLPRLTDLRDLMDAEAAEEPVKVELTRSAGDLVALRTFPVHRGAGGEGTPLYRPIQFGLVIGFLLLFALVWLVYDVNLTSLHRFYRDRLSKAWLIKPDGRGVLHTDVLRLSDLRRPGSVAPYHIVQAAVNVADKLPELHGRGADFFVFTKHWVGGPLAGWCRTERMQHFDRRLDLGTAMAVSGAAAAPQMGTETIRPLAFVMTLLNIRMGYWLPNPRLVAEGKLRNRFFFRLGPGPLYLIYEALGMVNLRHSHVFATDGEHIENLGVHELLRRRCRFIVAIDGEEDAERVCPSLLKVVRYARMDLGIEIEIHTEDIRLDEDRNSTRNWAVGTIRYDDDQTGILLYIKSTLTGREPDDILDERRQDPAFPHVSTADQFFTPQRFEAYRALGHWTGTTALAEAAAAHEDVAKLI